MKQPVSLVLLAVCLSSAFAQDKYLNKTKPCGPQVFAKLDSCCAMPKLLPFETFKNCFGKEGNDGVAVKKMAFSGKVRNNRDTAGKRAFALKPGRRSFGPKGGPMCLIECVLRNETLLDANNKVNVVALTKRFTESAGEQWKTQVEGQIKTCWDELSKVDFAKFPAPPSGVATCKPDGAMLMSCIRRGLILNCPASESKAEDQSCSAKLTKLKECDPFSIPPPRASSKGERKAKANGKKNKKSKAAQKKE